MPVGQEESMSVEPQKIDAKPQPDADLGSKVVDPDPRRSGGRKIVLLILFVAILGALVAFGGLPRYFQQQSLIKKKQEQLSKSVSVSYVVAAPAPALEDFVLPGATQAIMDAPVFARVNGYISKLYVNIGDQVHTGEILADVDTPEVDKQVQAASDSVRQAKFNLDNAKELLSRAQSDSHTAAANTQKAKTDLAFAKVEYDRYVQLVQQGAVSKEDTDTRLTNYNGAVSTLQGMTSSESSAQAAIRSATAAVQVAKAAMEAAQSQHDQFAASQSFKEVRAPFDGVVTKRNVDQGALVTSGSNTGNTVLFEIAKIDVLRIFVYIPEQFVASVHDGQEAKLVVASHPDQTFTATVAYIAGGLDNGSRTLQAELHIQNKNHGLLPGMYAQVHFQAPSSKSMAIVPGSALQTRADGGFVYTVDDQQRVHMHKVKIEKDLGGQVEISSGISVGDKVVISPSDDIVEGVLVNPVPLSSTH
jgi:RND family efflux transporter MFP subunit